MRALIVSTNFIETFLILRRTERGMIRSLVVFMQSTRYSCRILT